MDTIIGGIDVSKDKLDIAVRPSGEVFGMSRDAQGLDALIARLAPLSPAAVAVEATGGFETVVAASLAAAGGAAVVSGCGGLPVVVVNKAKVRCFAQACRKRGPRPTRSTLEHDPRKLKPVSRKDHAKSKALGRDAIQSDRIMP